MKIYNIEELRKPHKFEYDERFIKVNDLIDFIRLNECKGISVNGLDIEIELSESTIQDIINKQCNILVKSSTNTTNLIKNSNRVVIKKR